MNFLTFIYEASIPLRISYLADVLNFSNFCINPVVYVLRIPEFRQALGLCCFKWQAAMEKESNEKRDNRADALSPVTQLKTLPNDPSLQLTTAVVHTTSYERHIVK